MIRETMKNIVFSPLYYILLVCLLIGGYIFSLQVEVTDIFSMVGLVLSNVLYFVFLVIPSYVVLGSSIYKIQMKNVNLFQRITKKQYAWYQFKTLFIATAILFLCHLLLLVLIIGIFRNVTYEIINVDLRQYVDGLTINNILFCFIVIGRIFLFLFVCQIINSALRMILPKESYVSIIMVAIGVLTLFLMSSPSKNQLLKYLNPVNHLYRFIGNPLEIKNILGDVFYYFGIGALATYLLRRQSLKVDMLNKEDEE